MPLRKDMIDLFLETKDVLTEQVAAYRNSQDPDVGAYVRICAQLRELALEQKGESEAPAAAPVAPPAAVAPSVAVAPPAPATAPTSGAPQIASRTCRARVYQYV